MNNPLLTKIGWRLGDSNTDWSEIMRAKYLSSTQFIYKLYNDLPRGSKIWMNIMKSRGLLREGLRWVIGNGQNIIFWEDNWLGGRLLVHNKFNKLMKTLKRDIGKKFADYIDLGGSWKIIRKDNNPQCDIQLLEELEEMLGTYRLPSSTQEDRLIWDKMVNGTFSIKPACTHLFYND